MYIFFAHLLSVFIYPITGVWTLLHYFVYISGAFMLMSFFVISGYVITISIFLNKERYSYFCWKSYLRNRTIRFYPPLLLALLVSYLITPLANTILPEDNLNLRYESDLAVAREYIAADPMAYFKNFLLLHQVVSSWPTINNNGPLWTLGLEFWIYIGAMLIAVVSLNYRKAYGLIPMTLIALYVILDSNLNLMQLGGLWVLGALFAILQIYQFKPAKLTIYTLCTILLIVSALIFYHDFKVLVPFTDITSRLFQMMVMTLITIAFALYHSHARFPFSATFSKLGRISLSLYIFHFPLFLLFYYILHPIYHEQIFFLKIVIMLSVALVTFYITCYFASLVDIDSKLHKALKK